jgi:O-acetyl-ADP-ribose deacetylase (regulator of RNase III)
MRIVKGNLLDAPEYQIAHGCNAQGVMGSGVAKAIREKWPEAYDFYRNAYEYGDTNELGLGEIISAPTADGKHIIHNCVTQRFYGRDGQKYVNYAALTKCLLTIAQKSDVVVERYHSVAIPEIGCGFGGGDPDILYDICSDIETMYPRIEFVIYNI